MIQLTRFDKNPFYINEDLILFLESTPDTVVTLNDGKKIRVLEGIEDIIDRIVQFRRKVLPIHVERAEGSEASRKR